MKITKTSMLTGKSHTLDLDIIDEQFTAWQCGQVIQLAMPHLSAELREFLITGVTPEEWDMYVKDENNE